MVFTPNPNKRMDSAAAAAWTSSPEFAAAKAAFEAQKSAEKSEKIEEKTTPNLDSLPQYDLIDIANKVHRDRYSEMITEANTQSVPEIKGTPRHHDVILGMPAVTQPAGFEMGTVQDFIPAPQEESTTSSQTVHRGAAAIYQTPPRPEAVKNNNVQFNLPRVEIPPSRE